MIKLRQVRRLYQSGRVVTALDGITLDIASGTLIAIMGPSGSGKSTLLHLLGGLDRPTDGSIEIDGVEIGALDEEERTRLRREKIGIVFQFFNLLPSLSACENVELPLLLAGLTKKEASARALDTRAVVTRPALLLADEPTGNLDSVTGMEVMQVVHDVHRRLGTTIVLVTHDQEVARQCHMIVTLRDGLLASDSAAIPTPHSAEPIPG